MKPSVQKLHVDRSLDIRGLKPADGYGRAKAELQAMAEQQVLELFLDEGESLRRIPFGLRAEGHEIVVSEPVSGGVRLLVRKRPPLE